MILRRVDTTPMPNSGGFSCGDHRSYQKKIEVHGMEVEHNGEECGIYKTEGLFIGYAQMDMDGIISVINRMPIEQAIDSVKSLLSMVEDQVALTQTPSFAGPILVQNPPTDPINGVGKYIENTRDLAKKILIALETKQQGGK